MSICRMRFYLAVQQILILTSARQVVTFGEDYFRRREGPPDVEHNGMLLDGNSTSTEQVNSAKLWLDLPAAPRCVDIPSQGLGLCRHIGYNQMRVPNLFNHSTIDKAQQQLLEWSPLITAQCHKNTELFRCSMLSPVCLNKPIWPCRSLCETVRQGCELWLNKYNFSWPEALQCHKFPPYEHVCINVSNYSNLSQKENDTVCALCEEDADKKMLVQNYCQSDFAVRIKVGRVTATQENTRIVSRKQAKYLKGEGTIRQKSRRLSFSLTDVNRCRCPALELLGSSPKSAELLVMGKVIGSKALPTSIQFMEKKSKYLKKTLLPYLRNPDLCEKKGPGLAAKGQSAEDYNSNRFSKKKIARLSRKKQSAKWKRNPAKRQNIKQKRDKTKNDRPRKNKKSVKRYNKPDRIFI